MFPGILGHSLAGEALKNNIWRLETFNIRDFGLGRHKAVDDTPAGGSPGMVLRCDVLANALDTHIPKSDTRRKLLMSPRGRPLTQNQIRSFSQEDGLIILCGRFEGVDERIIQARNLEEVSIGDYILSGGEIAAQVVLDSCIRLLPGVMGKLHSGEVESFENGLLEYPHYTRPREWEGHTIPDVLLSGNHKEIEKWRLEQSQILTSERRPDLWKLFKDKKKTNLSD